MRAGDPHLVPADLRQPRDVAHLAHVPGQQPEPGGVLRLLAALEEELHADADPEDRDAAPARVHHDRPELVSVELARAVTEVPDARQDERASVAQLRLIAHELRVVPDRAERLPHRGEVAHPVVDDGDHQISPLLDGTPRRRGSLRAAASTTRPRPFMVASSRWWGFPVRICLTW